MSTSYDRVLPLPSTYLYFTPADENEIYDRRYGVSYKDMIRRKQRLFSAADLDGDKKLSHDELADFLHPRMYGW